MMTATAILDTGVKEGLSLEATLQEAREQNVCESEESSPGTGQKGSAEPWREGGGQLAAAANSCAVLS